MGIVKKIERFIMDFCLERSTPNQMVYNLSKEREGRGDMKYQGKEYSLLGKWLRRFASERGTL